MNDQIEKPPILVTGIPRSGTSLTAGILNICGAFGGDTGRADKSKALKNGKSAHAMFENGRIKNEVVKPYLQNINVDPRGQYPLPDVESLVIPRDWGRRIESIMLDEGYNGGPWFYKGAKMALIWPVLHYTYPNAKWVIIRRRSGDIVNSCLNTGFMRAFADKATQQAVNAENERDGWLWWVHQHEQRFREMIEAGLNCKVVWPERAVNGDYAQLMELIDWLGLEWDSNVFDWMEPRLWHARKHRHT